MAPGSRTKSLFAFVTPTFLSALAKFRQFFAHFLSRKCLLENRRYDNENGCVSRRYILLAALALALTNAAMGAPSAGELIQKGDVFYAKLQAAQALRFYLPAE